jgi:peptidoglycan hydrolase-like protein with peptidoglycan-binding domain
MEPDDPKRPWVKKLQVMLDQHPRIRLTPQDGMFGTNTKKAVIQFQQLANIYATGKVGKPTWQALKLTVHAIGLTDEQRAKRS